MKRIFPIIVFFLLVAVFFVYKFVDFGSISNESSVTLIFIGLIVILVIILISYIIMSIRNRKKTRELKHRDKLFNSLVKNSDTIYIMYDKKIREISYMTHNFFDVLGIKIENNVTEQDVIKDIFKSESLKSQLDSWDEESEFISQMFSYRNPSYQHTRWLKIKIYPIVENKDNYLIVLILDATKEHDQQHLLVSQASDIKSREKQLNQITTLSYDTEININMISLEYSLKNLKDGIKYLGISRKGMYDDNFIKELLEFVSDEDSIEFEKFFDLKNLSKNFEQNLLEPKSLRFSLANEEIWLEATAFFTTNKGEKHITILIKDVTENAEYMRNQNIMLQNALNDARQANDAKSEYISIISHEIRTPMNAIIGLSESVLSEDINEEAREDIENINSASNNLLEVIDGLLDISKIESGKISLEEKEYNTAKFFKDIISVTKERIGTKQLKLIIDVNKTIPSKLFGDSGKLRQILLNLISNAIKFSEEGSITIKAEHKINGQNTDLSISIIDTGVGIAQDKLKRLFNEEKKTADKNYIDGMGLYISKKLINLLNGSISAESSVGKGSTFTVKLSQKVIDDKQIGDIETVKITRKKAETFDAKDKKILVVDDNKLNIKVAEKLLKPYGCEVTSVLSGQECIDLVKDNTYDLILLDQMMPEMDGVTVLSKLKENKKFKTPVVVLTADAIVGVREKYIESGFADYLSKPINVDELNSILKKYLK